MRGDVGNFYLSHMLATAGPPELVLRGIELALADLEADDLERFGWRLSRLRRAIAFDRGHSGLVSTLVALLSAARAAGESEGPEAAKAVLEPLVAACWRARPAGQAPSELPSPSLDETWGRKPATPAP